MRWRRRKKHVEPEVGSIFWHGLRRGVIVAERSRPSAWDNSEVLKEFLVYWRLGRIWTGEAHWLNAHWLTNKHVSPVEVKLTWRDRRQLHREAQEVLQP